MLCSVDRLPGKLENIIALVTGGASGLGKAIAQRLKVDGAQVAISDVHAELGRSLAAEQDFTFIEHDVCSEPAWAQVMREIEQLHGALHILVNNAGILGSREAVDPENTRLEDWRRIFSVNVEGVFLGCKAAIPLIARSGGGSIINMSSVAGLRASPFATAYGASKATVRHFTQTVAQHCAERKLNIRCNSVHPGDVPTPLWLQHIRETAEMRGITVETLIEETKAGTPLGDLTRVEDVAAAVAFLVSDDARHITGSKLIVDGGVVHCDTFRSRS